MSGWTAAAIVGGSVLGGYITSQGSQSAANTQASAADQASQLQYQQFQQMQNNLAPYMGVGPSTIPRLQAMAGNMNVPTQFNYNPASDPGYQFRLQQGLQGVMDNATAMGGINSGATLKALNDYAQGQASQSYQQEFNNWLAQNSQMMQGNQQNYNQLYSLLGLGESAAAGVGAAGINTANNIAGNITGAANAQAANSIAQGNIWGSVAQQAFSPSNVNALMGYMNQGQAGVTGGAGTGAWTYGGTGYANPSYYLQ